MDRPAKIVAIHQPTFFPWLGFFGKIARADCFVFLDSVPNIKTGGSWVNRMKLIQGGQPKWFTCPIVRVHGEPKDVNQIEIEPSQEWRKKLVRTLEINYGRAACFDSVMPVVAELINQPGMLLAQYNEQCIMRIASQLGLTCQLVRQSELPDPVGDIKGSERLARICQQLEAKVYLAGDGADGYEQVEAYHRLNIELRPIGFVRRPYPQVGQSDFVPGLSVLDALLNVGFERTAELLV